VSFLPATGYTFNLQYLADSPIRHFTTEDFAIGTDAIRRALNETKDGETVTWINPDTGHSGSATPLSSYTQNGKECRKLKITNSAKSLEGKGVYPMCRQSDGKWKHDTGQSK
jgi:surface antigen